MSRLLLAEEVAEMIGMTTDWIYAETRKDRIPHLRMGRYYRYRPEAIETWLVELERGILEGSKKRPSAAATARGMAPKE